MSSPAPPSVAFPVTVGAECNQIRHNIVTEPASGFHVMDLQAFHGTAFLTAPTISFQDPVSDSCVFFRVQFEPGLLLT